MLLAIDAGNTNVTFAIYDGPNRRADWRIRTRPERTSDEFEALLANLFTGRRLVPGDIDAAVVCSVVPPATYELLRLCRSAFDVEPLLVSSNLDLGLEVRYRPPGDVGADRLVDAAMALERYGPAPLIFIDLGTGTTFNAIGAPNIYLGGAICPGLSVAWDAMFDRAARLYRVEGLAPPSCLADNTVNALQSGMVYGAACMIDGMVRRIQAEIGAHGCPVVATGGNLTPAICGACETITQVDRFLTLDGLALAHRRSTSGGAQ